MWKPKITVKNDLCDSLDLYETISSEYSSHKFTAFAICTPQTS